MPFLSNAHTHTLFCDGKNTPEEMVQQALSLGFSSLGFSGHSFLAGEEDWTMSLEETSAYKQEILRLRAAYKGKIRIYLGLEVDAASSLSDLADYEYIIGSVHETTNPATGKRMPYDYNAETFQKVLDQCFGSDPLKLAASYYGDVVAMAHHLHPQILGHFNLITKYNRALHLIDEDAPAYRKIASEALLDACSTGCVVEINTGAMARGHASIPYPALWMLKLLREHRIPVTITSDCHNKEYLAHGFDTAIALAKEAGYASVLALKKDAPLASPFEPVSTPLSSLAHPLRPLSVEELFEEVGV